MYNNVILLHGRNPWMVLYMICTLAIYPVTCLEMLCKYCANFAYFGGKATTMCSHYNYLPNQQMSTIWLLSRLHASHDSKHMLLLITACAKELQLVSECFWENVFLKVLLDHHQHCFIVGCKDTFMAGIILVAMFVSHYRGEAKKHVHCIVLMYA